MWAPNEIQNKTSVPPNTSSVIEKVHIHLFVSLFVLFFLQTPLETSALMGKQFGPTPKLLAQHLDSPQNRAETEQSPAVSLCVSTIYETNIKVYLLLSCVAAGDTINFPIGLFTNCYVHLIACFFNNLFLKSMYREQIVLTKQIGGNTISTH